MFRHPNYYKNLRKLARNRDSHVRPISGSADFDTDQAISPMSDGSPRRRSPGPGLKQQAIEETVPHNDIEEAQAASAKRQASGGDSQQASSAKRQASSPE